MMRWFARMNRALSVYGFLVAWFESASRDGTISAAELADGVQGLLEEMGYSDRIKVEPLELRE